jgi:hypothetical protein
VASGRNANLDDLAVMVADKATERERFGLIGDLAVLVERVVPWPWR